MLFLVTGDDLLLQERGMGVPFLVLQLGEEAIVGFSEWEWYEESFVLEMIDSLSEAYCQDYDRVRTHKYYSKSLFLSTVGYRPSKCKKTV